MALLVQCNANEFKQSSELKDVVKRDLSVKNPLKFLGKCLTDSECKQYEYCDHHRYGIGECKAGILNRFIDLKNRYCLSNCLITKGKENNVTCIFDRHCRSKVCHHLKCVAKKPVKDGPCTKNQHIECIPEQYCHHEKKDIYFCVNRKCSGLCVKNEHCLSNKCEWLSCKKPVNGCPK